MARPHPFPPLLAVALAGAALGWSQPAAASVVVVDTLETMAHDSEVIAHAQVLDQRVERDARGRIVTLTTLDVLDGLKGVAGGERLTLLQLGGWLDGEGLQIDGASRYIPGEEVVVFGVRFGPYLAAIGVGIGRFLVLREPDGARVVEDVTGILVAARTAEARRPVSAPRARHYATIRGFKAAIGAALATAPRPRGTVERPRILRPRVFRRPARRATP